MEWHEIHRRQLQLDYRGNYKTFEFNAFSDLLETASRLDLTGVRSARIVSRWPPESIISRHSDTYVEVKDAKKLMKKMGLVFRAAKLAPAERKAPEPEKPAAEQKAPESEKEDGIYHSARYNALVHWRGIEFVMPTIGRRRISFLGKPDGEVTRLKMDPDFFELPYNYAGKLESHALSPECRPVMVGLDAVLKKAEAVDASLIAFSFAQEPIGHSATGTYHFYKSPAGGVDPTFLDHDVAALREKVKTASLPK